MSDLTELGILKPHSLDGTAAHEPSDTIGAAADPFAERRADALAHLIDRLLDVLARLAPESDPGEGDTFRRRLQLHRQAIADQRHRGDLARLSKACVATCRQYLEGSRTYHREREKELTEIIGILREAAKLSVGDSAEFHARVIQSSERFTAIAEIENIREMRRRMGEEVSTLRRAVAEKQQREEQAYAQLNRRVQMLQQKLVELEFEASIDPLTRIGNRRRFDASLARMVAGAHERSAPLSLAILDIDHFKQINDTHGHPIGDRVLLCVAEILTNAVRQTDVVARYGGEEFAVLLENASVSEVEARFRKLLVDIAGSSYEYEILGSKENVRFTVSCGLVDLGENETAEEFINRADQALYEAKRKGRNRVVSLKRSLIGRLLAWP